MTVVFLSRLFYPHIGGVEKHVMEIGKALVKKGYNIIVITEQYDPKLKPKDDIEGINILRLFVGKNDLFKKFRIWRELWSHRRIIENADIIHSHDIFFWYLPFRFLYLRKPAYVTFHGYESYPVSKRAIIVRKISEKTSNGNICVGDFIKKWYKTECNCTIYGGVGLEARKSQLRAQNYNSTFKILLIGRLEEDTGVPIYLKILSILRRENVKFEFQACGDGFLKESVKKYGRVHGFVENLSLYLENSDIVFASSYLSILEAINHRKLVFAVFDNPLKKDYLEMSPMAKWIRIHNSPKKIVKKIKHFMKYKEEGKEMINEAYGWVKTQTWDNVAEKYLKLWNLSSSQI